MREILFRGKLVYNGWWVEGGFYKEPKDDIKDGLSYIITASLIYAGNAEQVHQETVGQFTGLLDKNGTKIFEGDIVRIEDFVNAVVKWREDIACWTLQGYIIGNTWGSSMLEVIDNIHDNPDLMKEIMK